MCQFIKKTLVIAKSCNMLVKKNFKLSMLFLLMIGSFIFISCEKEKAKEQPSTYIQFENISEYPFKVWLDGEYKGIINGGSSSQKYTITSGSKMIKVEQESGYFYFPLKGEEPIRCEDGYFTTYKFPIRTKGWIKIENHTNNNFMIYINGVQKGSVNAHISTTFEVDGWREYIVSRWFNNTYIDSITVPVDAGYVTPVTIN